jgi:hypothetical protein
MIDGEGYRGWMEVRGAQVARAESDWKREKPVENLKETYHMGQHNSLKRSHQEKI